LARSRSVPFSFSTLPPIWHNQLLTAVIARQRLGFESFTEEVEDVLKDHKQQQKVCAISRFLFTLHPHSI
jgi:hypothetical protein